MIFLKMIFNLKKINFLIKRKKFYFSCFKNIFKKVNKFILFQKHRLLI